MKQRLQQLLALLLCMGTGGMLLFGQFVRDSSFGTNGMLSLAPADVMVPVDWELLSGDSLLMLCYGGPNSGTPDRDIFVTKTDSLGNIDGNFGTNGWLQFDFDSLNHSTASDLFREDDGSFLIVGSGYTFANSDHVWGCVARMSGTGSILNVSGSRMVKLESLGFQEFPNMIGKDDSGRYVLAGSTLDTNAWHSQPVIHRFDANWKVDSSFGGAGKVLVDASGTVPLKTDGITHLSGGFITEMVVQGNGQIIVCGAISDGDKYLGLIARTLENGMLDPGFYPPYGLFMEELFPDVNTRITELLPMPDGSLYFGASTALWVSNRDFYLGRLMPGQSGWTTEKIGFSEGESNLTDLYQDPLTGNIYLFGNTTLSSNSWFSVAEIKDYEQPEIHSASSPFEFAGLPAFSGKILRQSHGRILICGYAPPAGTTIPGLILALRADGTVSTAPPQDFPEISARPNPSATEVHFTGISLPQKYTLIHSSGQFIQSGTLTTPELEVTDLAKGLYFLKFASGAVLRLIRE